MLYDVHIRLSSGYATNRQTVVLHLKKMQDYLTKQVK